MRLLSMTLASILVFPLFIFGIVFAEAGTMTDAKLFRLELELEPKQPVVGINAAVLIVTDAQSNRPIDDAVIEVVPWMTIHGHGSPKKAAIKKMGAGRYRVENLYYTMEGDWDLIITIQNKGAKDSATIPILNVKR